MNVLSPVILANNDYVVRAEEILGGIAVEFHFPNGWGLSVIRHSGSYGNKRGEGLFEAGLLKRTSDDWHFAKNSGVDKFDNSGIQGWLSVEDIDRLIIITLNLRPAEITA
jgi:hypothetical protein